MSTENADRSTAASDQPARPLSWFTATIVSVLLGLASAGLMTAVMFWIGDYYRGSDPSRDEEGRRKLQELRATEQKELETYGWINQTDGAVRIPIDRAMELLLREAPRREAPRREASPPTPTPNGVQPPPS